MRPPATQGLHQLYGGMQPVELRLRPGALGLKFLPLTLHDFQKIDHTQLVPFQGQGRRSGGRDGTVQIPYFKFPITVLIGQGVFRLLDCVDHRAAILGDGFTMLRLGLPDPSLYASSRWVHGRHLRGTG